MLVGALTYPVFLLATAIAVILIIAFFVAPNLVGLFAAMEKPVPPVIAALDTMRVFAIGNGGLLGIAAVAAVLVLGTLANLPSFRSAVRSVAFAVPMIGSVLTWSASRRFAETLKLYVASNVPLAAALPSALVAAGFPEGARRAEQLAADLRGGLKLSTAVAELKLLPEQVVHLLRVGEGNGKLVDVLGAAAAEASVRLERQSTLLSALLAPILIVVVGVVIGSIIFTVFSALLDINDIAA
jgi:general secretion pathway protein F